MAPENRALKIGRDLPRPSPDDVRVIGISEYKAASACLVEAFMEDEAIRYCIDTPDTAHFSPERKQKLYVDNMDYVTAAHIYNGLVTTIGPNHASVAIWLPPGKDIENWCTLFRSGLWRMYYKLSAEGRKRFFAEFLPLLHDTKRIVLGERDAESYYLVYIGTRPSEQRKGYGKALIEHITRQADREGRACYLESSCDKNVEMYKARGFVHKKKVYLNYAEQPIPLDVMIREPVIPSSPSSVLHLKQSLTETAVVAEDAKDEEVSALTKKLRLSTTTKRLTLMT